MVAPNLAQVCTEVNAQCPVESSIYGYYPSLPVNAFFLAWFAVLLIANLGLGIRYKTWTYLIALGLGCLSEVIGMFPCICRLCIYQTSFVKSSHVLILTNGQTDQREAHRLIFRSQQDTLAAFYCTQTHIRKPALTHKSSV